MSLQQIAIVVQGLFEKSDSIGYDAVLQSKIISGIFGENNVHLFAERFNQELYPDVKIRSFSDFSSFIEMNPDATVIYHFCDGWSEVDGLVLSGGHKFIVRWHNNTPPWFYGASHRRSVIRTIAGFDIIRQFASIPDLRFWVNSNFTLEQLEALGGDVGNGCVVFPGSRFLDQLQHPPVALRQSPSDGDLLKLLFVSRIVYHKGHKHVLNLAAYLQNALKRKVEITFIGRSDTSSGLIDEIVKLARELDIRLHLPGEVSHEDLVLSYQTADAFVCFSEHEGFGMPVFEAMRAGLPIITWGRTALAELMRAHPFVMDKLDFRQAASFLKCLTDEETRQCVADVQNEILATYSMEVLVDQIRQGLDGKTGRWPYTLETQNAARATVVNRAREVTESLPEPADLPTIAFDYGENFVTLHDVESYKALLRIGPQAADLRDVEGPVDFIRYGFVEFAHSVGRKTESGISFTAIRGNNSTFAIFGPYVNFVRGYFAADFEIEAEQSGDLDVVLELDVCQEGYGTCARRIVTVQQLQETPTMRLLFPVSTLTAVMEFRVRVVQHGNCNFLFKGVTVRSMRQSTRQLTEPVPSTPFLPRWLPGIPSSIPARNSFKGAALRHFGEGDAARDTGFWNDAAAAYKEGLKLEPHAFPFWVQLGNCLKEAERISESEAAYLRAFSLSPNDTDLNLQLGRLYTLAQDMEKAQHHLLRAAHLSSSTANAMLELAKLGFDISSLADLHA